MPAAKRTTYDGPNMHIRIGTPAGGAHGFDYEWEVMMKAADSSGTRKLGYRAYGFITGPNHVSFQYGPAVHDEERAVWTTMNGTDRPDIRKKFVDLVLKASKKMKDSGETSFEYSIP